MTRHDCQRCLEYLSAIYKGFTDGRDPEQMLTAWTDIFAEDDAGLVMAAVRAYASTGKFAPVPADIRALMADLTQDNDDDGLNAWQFVQNAARNGFYGAEHEWTLLPPICREIVSPAQLRAWSQMDEATVSSVAQSNFLRAYRAAKERKKADAMLPRKVRERRDAMLAAAKETDKNRLEAAKQAQIEAPKTQQAIPGTNRAKELIAKLRLREFETMDTAEYERRREATLEALRGGK